MSYYPYRTSLNSYMQITESLIKKNWNGTWYKFYRSSPDVVRLMSKKERYDIIKQLKYDDRFIVTQITHKPKTSPYSVKRLKEEGKKIPRCKPANRSYNITVKNYLL